MLCRASRRTANCDTRRRDDARTHDADVRGTTIAAVGVVVPAHNHAATISQCIHGIFAANSFSGSLLLARVHADTHVPRDWIDTLLKEGQIGGEL